MPSQILHISTAKPTKNPKATENLRINRQQPLSHCSTKSVSPRLLNPTVKGSQTFDPICGVQTIWRLTANRRTAILHHKQPSHHWIHLRQPALPTWPASKSRWFSKPYEKPRGDLFRSSLSSSRKDPNMQITTDRHSPSQPSFYITSPRRSITPSHCRGGKPTSITYLNTRSANEKRLKT